METAQKHGYQTAGRKHTQPIPPTKILCFMIFVGNIVNHSPFGSFVLQGVESAAAENGHSILVRHLYSDSILNPENIELLRRVDGLIILGTDICAEHCTDLSALLKTTGDLPKVIVDNMIMAGEFHCVCSDVYRGARSAVTYLIEQGFQSIGYLRSKQRIMTFTERERGMNDVLSENGLLVAPVVNLGIASDDAYGDMCAWLKTDPILPQSFFAENDVVAAAAIRAMNTFNISVPEQVSIIGFDDAPIAAMTTPPITTVKSFIDELGATAVHVILHHTSMPQNKPVTKALLQIYISMKLIKRESVSTKKFL